MDKSLQAVSVYNNIAEIYANRFKRPSDHIDDFLKQIKRWGKILDVGCGCGIDSDYMSSFGFEVIGLDLSDKMIELARQRFPDIEFRLSDMRKMEFQHASFDGILASFSLIHIPKKDIRVVLRLFYSLLTDHGGTIYLSVQVARSRESYEEVPIKHGERIFLNIFSRVEIREAVTMAGFFITKTYERPPQEGEHKFDKYFIIATKR